MEENSALYANVMDKLRFEPNIDESNLTIAIKGDGIIVLGGFVKSYTEKCLVEEAVKKIKKVHGVANEIAVNLEAYYKRSDTEIVKAALNSLKWNMFVPAESIKVSVEDGHLTLSGEVSRNYQKERAQKSVENLYGVTYVTNNIKIVTDIKPEDVQNKIMKEFTRNAYIDAKNIRVVVHGGKVTLEGSVRNFDEVKEACNAAWSVPGVTSVVDNLLIGR